MGVDYRNHLFAPGLSPGWHATAFSVRIHTLHPTHYGLHPTFSAKCHFRHFRALTARKPVALSVETPLCTYRIAYRRAYELFTSGLFMRSPSNNFRVIQEIPLKCGVWGNVIGYRMRPMSPANRAPLTLTPNPDPCHLKTCISHSDLESCVGALRSRILRRGQRRCGSAPECGVMRSGIECVP